MYRRDIRTALALLLVASPAHGGVIGDVVGGLGVDESLFHSRLGVRGGYETRRVGVLGGVDWADAGDEPGEDTRTNEHRFRALGLVSVAGSAWYVSAGGGVELERSRTSGFVAPPRGVTSQGYVVQTAAAYVGAIDSRPVGIELAAGTSAINGFFVDAVLFIRFGR